MQQEQSKLSDETRPGIACEIQLRKQGKYNYKFAKLIDEKFDALQNGDQVIVLMPSEHEDLLQQTNLDNNFDKEKLKEDYMAKIREQAKTIMDLKEMNDNLAIEKDTLEKQLERTADASEIEDLKEYKTKYEKLISDYTMASDENIGLLKDNKQLKETNQFLNENIDALRKTFDKTIEDNAIEYNNKEKELKETIEKQQTHIDELTEKYQSLLPSKEYVPQKQHYNEIGALKDEIKAKEIEIDKLNGEIETKLAAQKSDLEIAHTNEKAQMLVAYNQDLNNLKLQYNNLAKDYNHLLNGVDSLTRINTFFNGKHNEIKKDKEQVQMLEITSEQLPPLDENVLEYVPKD